MQFSGEIYDYIERTEGCFMILPHHFHPTNGVRPRQNRPRQNIAWTVIHESQHYKDWQDFWANNVSNHRSYVGGVELCDDKDGDRIPNGIEDANQNGIYEPSIDLYDWQQYNTPTPHRPSTIINDFEDWNCQRHKNVKGDHSKDWGDPGMQHKTRDKYND